MIGQLIHDKLITDFIALNFADNTDLFVNVKKFYAANSMKARDCLIIPDSNSETTEGQSAGNFQTTREYAFRAISIENLEETDNDATGSIKYNRLMNIQDTILNYLQKEPSNLNSWGATNSIAIYKIRVRPVRWDVQRTESGFSAILDIPFSIFLNVIPQNL